MSGFLNCLQMPRIHARFVVAFVMNVVAFWNRPNKGLVRKNVCSHNVAMGFSELAVSGLSERGNPFPTVCRFVDFVFLFESLNSVALRRQGQGLMQEVLETALPWAFHKLDMHRVMANYMPRNERSGRLLERLGFEREGYAKRYLQIAGVWEDHVLTSRVREP